MLIISTTNKADHEFFLDPLMWVATKAHELFIIAPLARVAGIVGTFVPERWYHSHEKAELAWFGQRRGP